MPKIEHLLWLDLETTGTDERLDAIIEVGCILTTPDLQDLDDWRCAARPPAAALQRLMEVDVVREMHQANGLLDLITGRNHVVPELSQLERALMGWLEEWNVEPHRVALAGSGVAHFDRRFIDAQMPSLSKHLVYWSIDVGVIRRAHQLWLPDVVLPSANINEGKTHRAADDIRCHLEEARAFARAWVDADRWDFEHSRPPIGCAP